MEGVKWSVCLLYLLDELKGINNVLFPDLWFEFSQSHDIIMFLSAARFELECVESMMIAFITEPNVHKIFLGLIKQIKVVCLYLFFEFRLKNEFLKNLFINISLFYFFCFYIGLE